MGLMGWGMQSRGREVYFMWQAGLNPNSLLNIQGKISSIYFSATWVFPVLEMALMNHLLKNHLLFSASLLQSRPAPYYYSHLPGE